MGDDWVVDSLLGFLQSQTWRLPVDSFIEQNCTVFDTEDENKVHYVEIHTKYQEMVEKLLESFTADLGITPQQLANACSQSNTLGEAHQNLFEQILASEDFLLFKSIMVHKNIDLELQALKLMQQQLGLAPEAYQPGGGDGGDDQETIEKMQKSRREAEEEEERVLREVLEQSKKEYERQKSHEEEEMLKQLTLAQKESLKLIDAAKKEEVKEVVANSLQKKPDVVSSSLPLPPGEKGGGAQNEKTSKGSDHGHSAPPKQSQKGQELPPLSPTRKTSSSKANDTSEAASLWLASAKADVAKDKPNTGSKPITSLPASNMQDIKAREMYLRQQRDHLIKLKNKARAKRVDGHTSEGGSAKSISSPSRVTTSPSHTTPTRTSSSKLKDQKMADSHRQKITEGGGQVQQKEKGRGEGNGAASLSAEKGKQRNTGVLCSAIADKLKMGQV